ncbi:MAG: CPBP family intramembrane metalloprotease [Melioribacteraceae bacterium]|nr:MAG: CPBP family intramembrane metalloprotease [Melioribacteraceae bacterium]
MSEEFRNFEDPPEKEDQFRNNIEPTMSPIAAAFTGLIVVFVLYQIGGSLLTLLIFGLDLESANVNAMRLMTIGGQVMFILLPALMFAKLVYEDVGTIIRFKLPTVKEVFAFVFGLILIAPLLQSYLYLQNYLLNLLAQKIHIIQVIKNLLDSLDKLVTETYSELLRSDTIFEASFIIFVVAVVPSICEEVFFRGYVQKSFEFRIKPVWAAFVTAIFFALYHFNPYGLIALFALGFFFGYSAFKSESIFIPLILHFLNNLIAIISFFIVGDDEFLQATAADPADLGINTFFFLFFLLLFLVYIYILNKNYDKLSKKKELL